MFFQSYDHKGTATFFCFTVYVHVCAYVSEGIFDEELPAVVTIADGETSGTVDIAVKNDALLMIGSQFNITLTSVQLHIGQ